MTLLALALSAAPAHAIVYGGNPDLSLKVDRPPHDIVEASVDLATVRVHTCGGGYTDYTIGDPVDLALGFSIPIANGDYCAVTVFWDSVMTIVGDNPDYDFVLEYSYASTGLQLQGTEQAVGLAPFTLVSGIIYGGNPALVVRIE